MSISETIREWLLRPVLEELKHMEDTMSALDDKTAAIVVAVTQLGTDLATGIADIKANSGAPTADQLARLDGIAASLTSLDVTVKSDDPGTATAAS